MRNDPGPPLPIPQDSIMVVRTVLPGGQVETSYVDRLTGLEVGLAPTYHLSRAAASFDPPPGAVIVEEAEGILAEAVVEGTGP